MWIFLVSFKMKGQGHFRNIELSFSAQKKRIASCRVNSNGKHLTVKRAFCRA